MNKTLHALLFVFLGAFLIMGSCKKDNLPNDPGNIQDEDPSDEDSDLGTITGLITDPDGNTVSGVKIVVSGDDEKDIMATSSQDGTYQVKKVSIKDHTIEFSKAGWPNISESITAQSFDESKNAVVNVSFAQALKKIVGTITDEMNNGAPLPGVTISFGDEEEVVTSGSDGTFEIEDLTEDTYTLTFTKENYATLTLAVKLADFIDDVATLDIAMGGMDLLPGLTELDLMNADKWYYNEYRGGRNSDAYPHWDWACDYMASMNFVGAWQEQNEGTTLQIQNSASQQSNPANLDAFDSYVYGSKLITEENKILSLRLRTHNADEASPAYFGVQIIDLSEPEPVTQKIGEDRTYGSSDYTDFDFDLSAYVGKEVVIAIGLYRKETGDYYKQLVLRAIRFADKKVEGTNWLPGTEVVNGWKLTQEMVRSTMVHTKKSFTGISNIRGERGDYANAYQAWRGTNHIAMEWAFMPILKDPEVFSSEGYLIKTRNTSEVNLEVPEAYFYAKFAIDNGSNKLTLKTRNFDSGSAPGHYTFFKLTAITEDGTVTHVEPSSNTAEDASAVSDGCWKFRHYHGSASDPGAYASFDYDLSQFNGKDVVLVFGVYNGEANTSENKLTFYNITLD